MRWKAALFDWDGTLVDSSEAAYASICAMFKAFDCRVPPKSVYMESINLKHKAFYHEHGIPETVTRDELNKIFMDGVRANIRLIRLRKYALSLLRVCRKMQIPTAIVSGASPAEYVAEGMKVTRIGAFIDHVRACATTKIPELQEVLQRLSVHPHDGFYLDDTSEGVDAANKVGLISVGIEGGFNSKEKILRANPDFLISSPGELIPTFLSNGFIGKRAAV